MRFYRRAQLSDDVFDSARSLWLAIENLLDEIAPWAAPERESQWVRRAFREAGRRGVALGTMMPPSDKDPHNAAHDYFYDELRKDLFHAKRGRNPALPIERSDSERIARRHRHLTELYRALLEVAFPIPVAPSGGGLTTAGFRAMSSALEGLVVRIGTGAAGASAPLRVQSVTADERKRVLFGQFDGGALEHIGDLDQIPFFHEGDLAGDFDLKAPLTLGGVARLETQFVLAYANAGEPRQFVSA
jgi:hypothetical protein